MKGTRILAVVVLSVAGWMMGARSGQADTLTIPAGFDLFRTDAATTLFELAELPSGFFGTVGGSPSDPVGPLTLNFEGNPTIGVLPTPGLFLIPDIQCWQKNGLNAHCVASLNTASPAQQLAETSTVVQRLNDLVLPSINSVATIQTEIVSLSLRSVAPIEVTYGGTNPQFFDVFVELDPAATQRLGTIVATRTGEISGVFDSVLAVAFQISFDNQNPSGPGAVSTINMDVDMTASAIPFRLVPEPSSWALFATGGLVIVGLARRRTARS